VSQGKTSKIQDKFYDVYTGYRSFQREERLPLIHFLYLWCFEKIQSPFITVFPVVWTKNQNWILTAHPWGRKKKERNCITVAYRNDTGTELNVANTSSYIPFILGFISFTAFNLSFLKLIFFFSPRCYNCVLFSFTIGLI